MTLPAVSYQGNTVNSVEPVEIPSRDPGQLENPGEDKRIQVSSEAVACPVENMRRISFKNCPYCGCSKIYATSSTTRWQTIWSLFLLRLVRCHVCMRRHYRPMFVPVAKYSASEPLRREDIGIWAFRANKKKRPA